MQKQPNNQIRKTENLKKKLKTLKPENPKKQQKPNLKTKKRIPKTEKSNLKTQKLT